MHKDLTQMSLEELWQLFPISLVPPRPAWQTNYTEMEDRLHRLLADYPIVRINHIGSTAIPGIWAKDIVDVLVELRKTQNDDAQLIEQTSIADPLSVGTDLVSAAAVLERDGFLVMSFAAGRVSLNLGYTPEGFADKVYHIHLRYAGDNDELYFRDYLRDHPDIAHDYETIKLYLWHEYEHDRDGYTAAKTDCVQNWTAAARAAYPGRYDTVTEN